MLWSISLISAINKVIGENNLVMLLGEFANLINKNWI